MAEIIGTLKYIIGTQANLGANIDIKLSDGYDAKTDGLLTVISPVA